MQSRGRESTHALTRTYEPSVNFARQSPNETPDTVRSATPTLRTPLARLSPVRFERGLGPRNRFLGEVRKGAKPPTRITHVVGGYRGGASWSKGWADGGPGARRPPACSSRWSRAPARSRAARSLPATPTAARGSATAHRH